MRPLILFLILSLAGAVHVAGQQSQHKKREGIKQGGAVEVERGEKSPPAAPRPTKDVQWPRPYQPSVEISADTTVPFPTDI